MYRRYEKTMRIIVSQISTKGKHYLSDADTKKLLNGHITLTEKLDGANTAVIRNKKDFRLQKRGSLVDLSEHPQFGAFKAWSQINYDKLMKIPQGTILYGEWCWAVHSIYYDLLPDYFLAFALYNRNTDQYEHWNDVEELCDKIGLHTVPLIAQGSGYCKDELFDDIPDPSFYGHEKAEGLVVWNYKKQMRGKIVRAEFQKKMDEDGFWRNKPLKKNIVSDKYQCGK